MYTIQIVLLLFHEETWFILCLFLQFCTFFCIYCLLCLTVMPFWAISGCTTFSPFSSYLVTVSSHCRRAAVICQGQQCVNVCMWGSISSICRSAWWCLTVNKWTSFPSSPGVSAFISTLASKLTGSWHQSAVFSQTKLSLCSLFSVFCWIQMTRVFF